MFSAELDTYKAFYVRGLVEDRTSFRVSPEDVTSEPFPTLDSADSFTLAAFDGESLAGILSFSRDGRDRVKLRHKGSIFRMYVASEHRGKGIARQLLQTALDRARALPDIEQINLTVVADNHIARTLYESFGFEPFSHERKAFKDGGAYQDEMSMVLFLRD